MRLEFGIVGDPRRGEGLAVQAVSVTGAAGVVGKPPGGDRQGAGCRAQLGLGAAGVRAGLEPLVGGVQCLGRGLAQRGGAVVVVLGVQLDHGRFDGPYFAGADLSRRLPRAEGESQDRARAVEQEGASFHRILLRPVRPGGGQYGQGWCGQAEAEVGHAPPVGHRGQDALVDGAGTQDLPVFPVRHQARSTGDVLAHRLPGRVDLLGELAAAHLQFEFTDSAQPGVGAGLAVVGHTGSGSARGTGAATVPLPWFSCPGLGRSSPAGADLHRSFIGGTSHPQRRSCLRGQ